ncbi:MAG TPA: isocitrate lyase/phosphoenolpyruvate mutase family protein [Terriglobales bacterium]|jgi:2-methylisocitrate lyase-like PEP mutase family enzyme
MNSSKLKEKAAAFGAMHHGPKILLLANVWDAASAVIVRHAGFGALATSSAGIAFSLGYPDGQRISREEMLAVVARITKCADIPVTADVEAGYGDRPEDAAETTRGVLEAGAVGMNLEDATNDAENPLEDLQLQVEKIRAVREVAASAGVPVVLNARTDAYLLEVGESGKRYDLALKRLIAFRDAGADCLFVPGVIDAETIQRFVRDLKFPLNILAGPGSPSVAELEKMGIARISLGSGVMRATLGYLQRIVAEAKTAGTYKTLEGAPTFAEMNRMLS